MYYNFFIHSCWWTFRLLPCSDYCNTEAVNTGVHASFGIMIFSGYMPVAGLLGYMAVLFWFLKESPYSLTPHTKISAKSITGLNIRKKVEVAQSYPTLYDPMDCSPWNSPGQNTGEGNLSLLQGIFPTQGSYPGLLHCRLILYQLSPKGSPECETR